MSKDKQARWLKSMGISTEPVSLIDDRGGSTDEMVKKSIESNQNLDVTRGGLNIHDSIQKSLMEGGVVAHPSLRKAGKGPGSRGGKVVGHTKSGKPIYDHSSHRSYKDFSDTEHRDATELHWNEAAEASKRGDKEAEEKHRKLQYWHNKKYEDKSGVAQERKQGVRDYDVHFGFKKSYGDENLKNTHGEQFHPDAHTKPDTKIENADDDDMEQRGQQSDASRPKPKKKHYSVSNARLRFDGQKSMDVSKADDEDEEKPEKSEEEMEAAEEKAQEQSDRGTTYAASMDGPNGDSDKPYTKMLKSLRKACKEGAIDKLKKNLKKGAKFDRCVKKVKAKGGNVNPYAVCHASIDKKSRVDDLFDLVKGEGNFEKPMKPGAKAKKPQKDQVQKEQEKNLAEDLGFGAKSMDFDKDKKLDAHEKHHKKLDDYHKEEMKEEREESKKSGVDALYDLVKGRGPDKQKRKRRGLLKPGSKKVTPEMHKIQQERSENKPSREPVGVHGTSGSGGSESLTGYWNKKKEGPSSVHQAAQRNVHKRKLSELRAMPSPNLPKSFVRSMGPGGIVMDFGPATGNPIADRATAYLNQFPDPAQASIANMQKSEYDKALNTYVEKGEVPEVPDTVTNHPEWNKQLNTPMDEQVKKAHEKGDLNGDGPIPTNTQFSDTQMNLGNKVVKATSETDKAVIEMMKSGIPEETTEGLVDTSKGVCVNLQTGEIEK